MTYLWLKAGHIIFVIFWMAGLFMLPRMFVYHQECAADAVENDQWIERERRILRIILWPSLVVVWLLGMALALSTGAFAQGWFLTKFVAVTALTWYQFWLADYAAKLARGVRKLEGKRLRLINEVPGIAAAVIVILVVLRPF